MRTIKIINSVVEYSSDWGGISIFPLAANRFIYAYPGGGSGSSHYPYIQTGFAYIDSDKNLVVIPKWTMDMSAYPFDYVPKSIMVLGRFLIVYWTGFFVKFVLPSFGLIGAWFPKLPDGSLIISIDGVASDGRSLYFLDRGTDKIYVVGLSDFLHSSNWMKPFADAGGNPIYRTIPVVYQFDIYNGQEPQGMVWSGSRIVILYDEYVSVCKTKQQLHLLKWPGAGGSGATASHCSGQFLWNGRTCYWYMFDCDNDWSPAASCIFRGRFMRFGDYKGE